MEQPQPEQLELIQRIVSNSIDELIENDSNIFNMDEIMPRRLSADARELNRELHETTINHRLAYYLECNLAETPWEEYNVDIEYNRFYGNPKELRTVEGLLTVRPDILIHSRINERPDHQHLLVVEAKKGIITAHDINKIEGFISDENYNYMFGLTVSYCHSGLAVLANIHYFNGDEIVLVNISRPKA